MAFIIKTLSCGNVSVTTLFDLYLVPAGKAAIVTSARLTNHSTANNAQVNLLVRASGAAYSQQLTTKDYSLPVGADTMVMEDPVTLGQGDKLQILISGTSPSVHCVVNGVERE